MTDDVVGPAGGTPTAGSVLVEFHGSYLGLADAVLSMRYCGGAIGSASHTYIFHSSYHSDCPESTCELCCCAWCWSELQFSVDGGVSNNRSSDLLSHIAPTGESVVCCRIRLTSVSDLVVAVSLVRFVFELWCA